MANPPVPVALGLMMALSVFEMAVPVVAERRGDGGTDGTRGTPWHAHHIAERYSLLVIITLGEVITGTVLAISAVVQEHGWSVEAVLVAFGGTLLAFGMWWAYFIVPSGRVLHRYRERSFWWGYLHIVLFGSVAAVGAGLHVAANVLAHEAHEIDATFALWTVAVPVIVFLVMLSVLSELLVRRFDAFHLGMLVAALAIVAIAIAASAAGATLGTTIVVVALAPLTVVVGHETVGYRKSEADLERLGV
ncbi:MAG: low temperature requirement protein A [Microbacterium sp.]